MATPVMLSRAMAMPRSVITAFTGFAPISAQCRSVSQVVTVSPVAAPVGSHKSTSAPLPPSMRRRMLPPWFLTSRLLRTS